MDHQVLKTDDYELVQNYLVNQITAQMHAGANRQSWIRMVKELRPIDREQWARQTGFLFDYTLGRFLCAIQETVPETLSFIQAGSEFLGDFLHAVATQNYATAEGVWNTKNAAQISYDGSLLPSTSELTEQASTVSEILSVQQLLPHLPPEFFPPNFVS
ncbi:hypothetical protein [Glutamicibacter nicotianae]|uniref:hypothetical protein n=1 Tax=Glutamicibacter nicotianae TaxID=37929 RepID=UPI000EF881B8|nr:hypothetical protein [Glutamicibacter nicotianae]